MSMNRDSMIKALRETVVPRLRERGFSGSFPHLRRCRPDRIDLLTFQFDRDGGGFILELGRCDPDGFTTAWGKQISPNKVTAWDLNPSQRVRLQPRSGPGTDGWFRYDGAGKAGAFIETAESVLPFIDRADAIFADFAKATVLAEPPESCNVSGVAESGFWSGFKRKAAALAELARGRWNPHRDGHGRDGR